MGLAEEHLGVAQVKCFFLRSFILSSTLLVTLILFLLFDRVKLSFETLCDLQVCALIGKTGAQMAKETLMKQWHWPRNTLAWQR